jgi:hypothetical protein
MAWAEASPLNEALSRVRASRADLAVRGDRWETRHRLPLVDDLLADPLSLMDLLPRWSDRLSALSASAEAVSFGMEALGVKQGSRLQEAPDVLSGLAAAASKARSLARAASEGMTPAQKERAAAVVLGSVTDDPDARPTSEDYEVMGRFDLAPMLGAGRLLAAAVDRALPLLPALKAEGRRRWTDKGVTFLLSGAGDDEYTAADLEGVDVLVDLGGRSRYSGGSPASAGDGEVRLVIDLSADVVVESTGPAAGSGRFGIGLMYLPTPGPKKLTAGDVSLGAGLFGVGGLFVAGDGARITGGTFTQGAGGFGLGLLSLKGAKAAYSLRLGGQGLGLTRGAGLLLHRGDEAVLDGGLTVPDPRESAAALSLSQGAGLGPRAYASGGVGAALIEGSRCVLSANYMAQGMGYWHSLGALLVRGEGNSLRARRYVQGAGVHTAMGGLSVKGGGNKLETWGVGPAMGWDYGVGALVADGDGNAFSSNWASGRGDVNGHGLALIRGAGAKIALSQLGSGAFKRSAASYGLAVAPGTGTVTSDAWGVLLGAEPAAAPASQWPPVAREKELARERERLEAKLAAAETVPPERRPAAWLEIVSDSGLDNETAMKAATLLAASPHGGVLLDRVDPDNFNEFIWLRTLLPGWSKAPLKELVARARGLRRALLMGFYRSRPATEALPVALGHVSAQDWRQRREAAGIIGSLFARQWGLEAGRLRLLQASADLISGPDKTGRLGDQVLSTLYGVLALDEGFTGEERVSLLLSFPSPFEPAGTKAWAEYARILRSRPRYAGHIAGELVDSSRLKEKGRAALHRLVKDSEPEVVMAALTGLGLIGDGRDARLISRFLEHRSALLREAASAALGRMGEPARSELRRLRAEGSPRTRALAALSLSHCGEPGLLSELSAFLADSDAEVRRTAAAGVITLPRVLDEERKKYVPELRKLAETDPSPAVRGAARAALRSAGA